MHAADRHQLIAELHGGVRIARAEDVLAESAACGSRARLAAFELVVGLVGRCAGDADLAWPVFLSPTGMSRLFHHDKELGVARAAAKFGTMYSLSTMATRWSSWSADMLGAPELRLSA